MKKSKISLALLAALYVQVPSYALAEEAEAAEVTSAQTAKEKAEANKAALKESDIEVITIGGMRSSEIAAINMKKFADTISDNLSAEEIGALPDQSIAESLERLVGVTGNQDNGRSNTISVRGMGGAYTLTTLNEREIVSSFGSRSINLSLFPGPAIRRAQVYKTARADGLEGGISGHVNMETFKPLEVDRNIRSFSASVNSNEMLQDLHNDGEDSSLIPSMINGDNWGRRLDGLFSHHITDNLAVSIGGAWRDDIEYFERAKNAEITGGIWPPDFNNDGVDDFANPATTLTSSRRDTQQTSYFAALQWAPTSDLVISVDYLSSDFKYQAYNNVLSNWGIGSPAKLMGDPALADVHPDTNFLMSGMAVTDNIGKWDAAVLNEDATKAYGLNIDYVITDDLALNVDISHSSAERFYSWRSGSGQYANGLNHYFAFDHYNGENTFEYLGSDTDGSAYDADSYTFDQSKTSNVLDDPDLWNFTGMGNGHNYMDSYVSAAKFDLTYDIDVAMFHQVKFGARYSENTKDHIDDGENYDENTENWDKISDIDWHARNTKLTNNPYQVLDVIKGFDGNFHFNPGQILKDKAQYLPERVMTDQDKYASYELKESTKALYLQTSFAGEWYDGIFGVRYYETELESTSFQSDFTVEQKYDEGTGEPIEDAYLLVPGPNPGYKTSVNKYSDVLPTLNVNLRLIDDVVIRVGAGKAMIRPSLGEINSSIQLKDPGDPQDFEGGEDGANQSKTLGTAGNPYLMPITSKQVDVSFEYYPNRWDFYAIAGFYKDLDGIYAKGSTYIPIEGSEDSRGNVITMPLTSEQKTEGGSVSGWEFSFRQDLGTLTDGVLHGIAISGNYMDFFHDAKQDYNRANPGQAPMVRRTELYYQPAGWIDSTYNVAITYDTGAPLSARLNLNQQQGTAHRDGNDGKYALQWPSKNLSFSLRYRASKEVTFFAQASNLLNEVTVRGNLSSDKLGVMYDDVIYEQSARGISWYGGVRFNF